MDRRHGSEGEGSLQAPRSSLRERRLSKLSKIFLVFYFILFCELRGWAPWREHDQYKRVWEEGFRVSELLKAFAKPTTSYY